MGWLKLDDLRLGHPKLVEAGPMAELLDVRGMLYSAQRETDGFVPAVQLPLIAHGIPAPTKRVRTLVEVRRWHEAGHDCKDCPQPPGEGWQIHGFLEFNPSRQDREDEREAARERMRALRQQKQDKRKRSGEQQANVRANFGRSSGNVRSTPSRPPVLSEQEAHAHARGEPPTPGSPHLRAVHDDPQVQHYLDRGWELDAAIARAEIDRREAG